MTKSYTKPLDVKNLATGGPVCPLPISRRDVIQMAHGGGGRLSQALFQERIFPAFSNPVLDELHDGAVLTLGKERLAFTTDSHVVKPLFFPGGDIGKLAVCGTVNDLAMCGARPLWLSAAFVLEEGFPLETLQRIVVSMQRAAANAGVQVVTGDTKVVDRGKGDGIYVTTSGVGRIEYDVLLPSRVVPGDAIVLSGDIARHGIAVMAAREELMFEGEIDSDCASVAAPVMALLEGGIDAHCMRDLTRGGLATALVEIAASAGVDLHVEDTRIPVHETIRGACEILGLDPHYVANEGRFVAFIPEEHVRRAMEILNGFEESAGACVIGKVESKQGDRQGRVMLKSAIGVDRVLDLLSGEQLPRIC